MPTLLVIDGFRFFFWANENQEPPHVHVEKGDGRAKWWLSPPSEAWSRRLKPADARRVKSLVIAHAADWLKEWHAFFER